MFAPINSVEEHLRDRAGQTSTLCGTVFQGGLTEQAVKSILEAVSSQDPSVIRARLESHIDKPESHELPEEGAVITEAYTEEEARGWIDEYQKAMSEVAIESEN